MLHIACGWDLRFADAPLRPHKQALGIPRIVPKMSELTELDEKVIETYVLFKRLFLMLELHVESNRDPIFNAVEDAFEPEGRNRFNETLAGFNFVFLFVDLIVRIKKTAYKIPVLNQKEAEYRKFNDALGAIVSVRDRFQHANNDIINADSDSLIGAISWTSEGFLYCLTLQDVSREKHSTSIPVQIATDEGGVKAVFDVGLSYVFNEVIYDLDSMFQATKEFTEYVDSRLNINFNGEPLKINEHYGALRLSATRPEVEDA